MCGVEASSQQYVCDVRMVSAPSSKQPFQKPHAPRRRDALAACIETRTATARAHRSHNTTRRIQYETKLLGLVVGTSVILWQSGISLISETCVKRPTATRDGTRATGTTCLTGLAVLVVCMQTLYARHDADIHSMD